MCGIAGVVGPRPPIDLRAWGNVAGYRGPDHFGSWHSEDAALIHNRLAIIDLSPLANQPMVSEDGRYVIVFNGEIYNFSDLKKELESLGRTFNSSSDTEVLLQGFSQWGDSIFKRLDGMFAFAIWDCHERTLCLARDHAGMKPLFYAQTGRSLIFGSEIKHIFASGMLAQEVDQDRIYDYLAYSYIPAPTTAFKNVATIPPGHLLRFNLGQAQTRLKAWWSLPSPDPKEDITLPEAMQETRRLIGKSVERRLVADVNIGAFLSGGIDSSVIVTEMARISGKRVKTFSLGFKDADGYDESQYAHQVASAFSVDNQVVYVEPKPGDIDGYLDRIVNHFDQPYANPTVILTAKLSEFASSRATVGLVGDGGDEMFGGYPRYWALMQQERFAPFIRHFQKPLNLLLGMLPERPGRNHLIRRVRRFVNASGGDSAEFYSSSVRMFLQAELARLVNSGAIEDRVFLRHLFLDTGQEGVGSACYADQLSFLPYNLLEGADRMSMAHSFELRLPFVDRELAEFCSRLPDSLRIRKNKTKFLLKESYRGDIANSILDRPKRGFNPPVWHWLKNDPEAYRSLLRNNSTIYQYLSRNETASLIEKFEASQLDNSAQLWGLLVLDRWLAKYS